MVETEQGESKDRKENKEEESKEREKKIKLKISFFFFGSFFSSEITVERAFIFLLIPFFQTPAFLPRPHLLCRFVILPFMLPIHPTSPVKAYFSVLLPLAVTQLNSYVH
jgi:hypothetical protein